MREREREGVNQRERERERERERMNEIIIVQREGGERSIDE